MSYFKRFTNFCGGFVAFAAILHLIGAYMSFEAIEAEGTLGKLKEFLDVKQDGNFRGYAIMALLFLLSAALGRIFERLPYVTLAVSLFPLYQTVELYSSGALVNFPSLYLILSIFHALGNIVYALALDRADGKRRAFVSAAVLGTMISAGGVWLWRRANELKVYDDPEVIGEELSGANAKIALAAQDGFQKLILKIAIMIAISVLISLLLRDIYFIDAILSVVPLAYALNKVLLRGEIAVFGVFVLTLCVMYFAARVAIMVFEPMRVKKAVASVDNKDAEMV